MLRSFLVLFALAASAGTLVGHPVHTKVASGAGLVFTAGALPISDVTYGRCDGTYTVDTLDEVLDPVAEDEIVLPEGYTCHVRLDLFDPVELEGYGTGGGTFELALDVVRIDMVVDPPIYVPTGGASGGTAIRLADTDWVTATLLDLDPNEHAVVDSGSSLHDDLRDAIRQDSETW